tara:strand:+ start:777 stop:1445 length:669 start_codon:yes stop_codon:yes gene_type:complete
MIYVLTYNAPHKKTQDLLFRLKMKGYDNVSVFATPWQKRKNFRPLIPHRQFDTLDITPLDLCKKIGYKFKQIALEELCGLDNHWILIGGAGILPKSIVEKGKVINSHPGYLPFVRGLDALKWAIYNDKPIGVTTHIISEDCDAGKLIRRELVELFEWDTFHSLAIRQYEKEVNMLVSSIEDIKDSDLDELSNNISEPTRRMPHRIEVDLLKKFNTMIKKNNE